MHKALHHIKAEIQGELRSSIVDRILYSTDASIFQITPLAVAFPKCRQDLVVLVQAAREYQIPITARGAGTSLAGQAVGTGIIVDFSRYLNKFMDLNVSDRQIKVEPGLVLAEMNNQLAQYGLMFGPDPASADRATVGGVIATNASGAHSINYGMAVDHTMGITAIGGNGDILELAAITIGNRIQKQIAHSQAAKITEFISFIHQHKEIIKEKFPHVWRRASGYNLNYLLPWSGTRPLNFVGPYPPVNIGMVNPAHLIAGSEGTLALISDLTLNVVKKPECTGMAILSYDSIYQACRLVPELLEYKPAAVELIPSSLLKLAWSLPHFRSKIPESIDITKQLLVIEVFGSNPAEIQQKLSAFDQYHPVKLINKNEQERIWEVRKAGLGILMSRSGDAKPAAFMEDAAVPVEHLGEYVQRVEYLLAEMGAQGDFYAHASAGCLHIRPIVNLKTQQGIRQVKEIMAGVEIILGDLGGSISGEHGDGRIRSKTAKRLYGEEIYGMFVDLKNIFDPEHILNPGVIIEPQEIEDQLRYGETYSAEVWEVVFDYARQDGLAGAIEMCNGAAVCRKADGVMCPSFQATQMEQHSTRARANILRTYISKTSIHEELDQELVKEVLDLCLECKACKAECPSSVDVAKLKYEFLEHYYQSHSRPIKDHFFANFEALIQLGAYFPGLTNALLKSRLSKVFFALIGITSRRSFPELHKGKSTDFHHKNAEKVIIIPDVYARIFDPRIEETALKLLQASGFEPVLLNVTGTGRSLISRGFLRKAKKRTGTLLRKLEQLDKGGNLPVICLEPSETMTLLDECKDLHPDSAFVEGLQQRAWNIDEFLIRSDMFREICSPKSLKKPDLIHLHGHCYQKARPPHADGKPVGVEATEEFFHMLGYNVSTIDSGCCGMAGSFGYEEEHYEVSQQVGELKLFPYLREHGVNGQVAAAGFSCREQIQHGVNQKALHPLLFAAHLIED